MKQSALILLFLAAALVTLVVLIRRPAPSDMRPGPKPSATPISPAPATAANALTGTGPDATARPAVPPVTLPEALTRVEQAKAGMRAGAGGLEPPREPVSATLSRAGRRVALPEVRDGAFPPVLLNSADPFDISVTYAESEPGDAVQVEILDGGRFADINGAGRVEQLDGRGGFAFRFVPSGEAGLFRIGLRKGMQRNEITLWAGRLPEMHGAAVKVGEL